MIARLSSVQLRKIADQLDAWTSLVAAGGPRPDPRIIHLQGVHLLTSEAFSAAYLAWWQDGDQYLAEFISFTPEGHKPLMWNEGEETL